MSSEGGVYYFEGGEQAAVSEGGHQPVEFVVGEVGQLQGEAVQQGGKPLFANEFKEDCLEEGHVGAWVAENEYLAGVGGVCLLVASCEFEDGGAAEGTRGGEVDQQLAIVPTHSLCCTLCGPELLYPTEI